MRATLQPLLAAILLSFLLIGCGSSSSGSSTSTGSAATAGSTGSPSSSSASSGSSTASSSTTSAGSTSASSSSGSSGSAASSGSTGSSSSTGGSSASSGSSGSSGSSSGGGLALGATCSADADCASTLCRPVVLGTAPVCVTPCTQPSDCATAGFFCEPITAGATDGYCIPQSPAHCLSCTTDADCGSLSETCFQHPGDVAPACHVDCSIAGAAACPSDYSCVQETVNNVSRMLCVPTAVPHCLDAQGGFCDRLTTAQPCERTDSAGSCVGERTCDASTGRFTGCSAQAPQCKSDCSMQDPAGCTESFCASATSTINNCGQCANVCPGIGQPNDNVTCDASQQCTFSCQGETYDVNHNPADGCEDTDSPTGNHTQATATASGSISDCDGTGTTVSLSGTLYSDDRVHEQPAVSGFDVQSGSAPDWLSVIGVGSSFCQNDLVLTFTVTGSANPSCYAFTVVTDKAHYTCQPSSAGTCSFSYFNGQFSDNSIIYFGVSKTCGTNITEAAGYTITGHL